MNFGTNNANNNNNLKNDNDMPDGIGKSKTILGAMDLENYEPSYYGYAFFQPAYIASYATTTRKTKDLS